MSTWRAAIFIGRFWAFRPEQIPFITFARAVYRDNLLSDARPGDRIAMAVTKRESSNPERRGRLFGLAEIDSHPVDTAHVVDLEALTPRERVGGQPRCPKAIPMRRAWRFDNLPSLPHNIEKRMAAETGGPAIALTPFEARSILAFQHHPVPVFGSPQGEIFAFRFGNRDVWKTGNSFDTQRDIEGINRNVPTIVIREAWGILCRESVTSRTEALIFETRLAESLADYRISGDVYVCPQTTFERAWKFVRSEVRSIDAR